MENILIEGNGLRLRRAEMNELDYIIELQNDSENRPFVMPFTREFHRNVIERAQSFDVTKPVEFVQSEFADDLYGADDDTQPTKLPIIIETSDGSDRCGYFLVKELNWPSAGVEHVIIGHGHKGQGVGHRAMRLLKRWAFKVMNIHRLWLDCLDTNARAIHFYESEGFRHEALLREVLPLDGGYKSLIIFAILRREYLEREGAE